MSWISAKHQYHSSSLTFEKTLEVFESQIMDWQLGVADEMLNGEVHEKNKVFRHSAFAAMSVMLSFIENIAKYQDGYAQDGQSRKYFREGLQLIHPNYPSNPNDFVQIYEQCRCGLYHTGHSGLPIRRQSKTFEVINDRIVIDPHLLIKDLIRYFEEYIVRLKKDQRLRENFIKRWQFLTNFTVETN